MPACSKAAVASVLRKMTIFFYLRIASFRLRGSAQALRRGIPDASVRAVPLPRLRRGSGRGLRPRAGGGLTSPVRLAYEADGEQARHLAQGWTLRVQPCAPGSAQPRRDARFARGRRCRKRQRLPSFFTLYLLPIPLKLPASFCNASAIAPEIQTESAAVPLPLGVSGSSFFDVSTSLS